MAIRLKRYQSKQLSDFIRRSIGAEIQMRPQEGVWEISRDRVSLDEEFREIDTVLPTHVGDIIHVYISFHSP